MVARPGLTWDKGLKKLHRALKKGATPDMIQKHMGRANLQAALVAVGHVRKTIQEGRYAENAALTVELKGSSKPLVGRTAQLFGAIGRDPKGPALKIFVGVDRKNEHYDVAKTIHNGKAIRVTDRMRNMFRLLWLKSQGANINLTGRPAELWSMKPGGWYPLRDTTEHIIIPRRPFIEKAFQDPKLRELAEERWEAGLNALFAELRKG